MARIFAFPDSDPVLGKPTVNGFTGITDLGVPDDPTPETGYGLGMRVDFESGSLLSPVILQGVKGLDEDYIYLSFLVRFDNHFDQEDAIVIALRPNYASQVHDASCRRIDIFPLYENVGAGLGPVGPNPDIRTGQQPKNYEVWMGKAGGGWDPIDRASAGLSIGVRSWRPEPPKGGLQECAWSVEVRIPTRYEGWLDLGPEFGLYVDVIRVCASTTCKFTGPAAESFFSNQFTWPNEADKPYLTGTLNGTLTLDPLLYGKAVIPAYMTPPGLNLAKGVKFVGGAAGIGVRLPNGTFGSNIEALLTNTLVAKVQNDSLDAAGDAPRVTAEFRLANWGLGSGAFTSWSKIATSPGVNPTAPVNIPHGTNLQELSSQWALSEDQKTNYKSHAHQCMWVQLEHKGALPVQIDNATNTTPITVTTHIPHGLSTGARVLVKDVVGNTGANNTSAQPSWLVTVTGPTTLQLNGSAGNGNYVSGGSLIALIDIDFVESSQRRNMDFMSLSEVTQPAEISGVGYPAPTSGNSHDFVLMAHARQLSLPDLTPRPDDGRVNLANALVAGPGAERLLPSWTWIVHGYRDTGDSLRIGSRDFRIYDHSPGAFGYLAQHDGPATDVFDYSLEGGGIKKQHDHVYTVRVPHNGVVTIQTVVSAGPDLSSRPGCLGWLMRLLRWLRKKPGL
jgi:hypothetical protein